ncbi:hypothetical protein [Clostridium sp. CMCC3677]|uniref:hypothetical protein n=1 Tax=Clostridium sp. CMCC3677 TaxID=2949963 RepID=UPI0013F018F6|nr:hypothetical protein [Clostridium sp. CMCC3677]NFG63152.1 hypothetical protein [Clostridium botulinum]NFQ10963.1 hypothetical protein [Clostridium botulinum]
MLKKEKKILIYKDQLYRNKLCIAKGNFYYINTFKNFYINQIKDLIKNRNMLEAANRLEILYVEKFFNVSINNYYNNEEIDEYIKNLDKKKKQLIKSQLINEKIFLQSRLGVLGGTESTTIMGIISSILLTIAMTICTLVLTNEINNIGNSNILKIAYIIGDVIIFYFGIKKIVNLLNMSVQNEKFEIICVMAIESILNKINNY